MSDYDLYVDIDEGLYGLYQSWCRANEVVPKLDGFILWKDEKYPELDSDEPDWSEIERA